MRRALRWSGYFLVGVLGVAVIAYAAVYVMSERILNRLYDVPAIAVTVPHDSAAVAEGERLARVRGCHGCHGAKLDGAVFLDEPNVARLVAPNLTRVVPTYDDAELARLLVHGVRKDGSSVVVMPSSMFYHLSDADVGAIIAHLRAAPLVDHDPGEREVRILGRVGLVTKQFNTESSVIDHAAPRLGNTRAADDTSQVARGEYLARTSCTECHGPALRGDPLTPSLARALDYPRDAFGRLLKTGVPRDGRDLTMMDDVARERFSHLRDDEVDAIYAFLRTIAPAPVPAATPAP